MNIKNVVLSLSVLAFGSVAAFGQQSLSSTTLSAAVTSTTAKSVVLASVSAVTVPGVPNGTTLGGPVSPFSYEYLYVDRELMKVNALSGSTVFVQRGATGTRAMTHNSGATVYVVHGSQLASVDLAGSCTITGSMVLPQINPATGNTFNCVSGPNGNSWAAYSAAVDAPSVGAAIASASTIAPTAPVTHVTGTTNIATITVPAGLPNGGQLTLIFDSANGFTAAGNIAVASTTTTSIAANSSVTFTYDAATSKWYPSHL